MSDTAVVDEVTPSPQSTEPKSLQNGLGLEKLLTAKKPSPPKDPLTGKFMKADGEAKQPESPSKTEAKRGDVKSEAKPENDLEKRLKDTRDYATQMSQKSKELERQLAAANERLKVLEAKIDGTYVEPAGPSPEQLEEQKRWMERVNVDNLAVIEKYGADQVQQRIWDKDSPYMKLEQSDPLIMERMRRAERPVLEAWKIVERYEFEQKYGSDPEAIKQAIIAEHTEALRQELEAEIKGTKPRTIESVNTLSGVGGVPRQQAPSKPATGPIALEKVFPLFTPKVPSTT